MKLVLLIGDAAVGKMTVGQELAKLTGLRLFHNHMSIEPVIEIFGYFHPPAIARIREAVFEEFAASGQYGMIFTMMWAFDMPSDREYVEHIKSIFAPHGTEFYCAELVAPLEIRRQRNATENRLLNKPSKRDIAASDERLMRDDAAHRLVSLPGEVPFENYMRLDNSSLTPLEAAESIRTRFKL